MRIPMRVLVSEGVTPAGFLTYCPPTVKEDQREPRSSGTSQGSAELQLETISSVASS